MSPKNRAAKECCLKCNKKLGTAGFKMKCGGYNGVFQGTCVKLNSGILKKIKSGKKTPKCTMCF